MEPYYICLCVSIYSLVGSDLPSPYDVSAKVTLRYLTVPYVTFRKVPRRQACKAQFLELQSKILCSRIRQYAP